VDGGRRSLGGGFGVRGSSARGRVGRPAGVSRRRPPLRGAPCRRPAGGVPCCGGDAAPTRAEDPRAPAPPRDLRGGRGVLVVGERILVVDGGRRSLGGGFGVRGSSARGRVGRPAGVSRRRPPLRRACARARRRAERRATARRSSVGGERKLLGALHAFHRWSTMARRACRRRFGHRSLWWSDSARDEPNSTSGSERGSKRCSRHAGSSATGCARRLSIARWPRCSSRRARARARPTRARSPSRADPVSTSGPRQLERRTLWLPSAFCGLRRSRFVAPPRDTPVSVVVAPRDPAKSLEILGPPNRLSL
jgi:hypothetical protein